uniref:ATP synthase F0 subunit 8 n=1 Tax=Caulacanthus ustulatus TaxID=31411 RepID=UPI0030028274|nr:ATP synthase F0 subunit 8 [Caulacanthus ustulatus]
MPQLDRLIVFTQIFWLFFFFALIYAVLTHFFLPLFIKSLKSRKQIEEHNLSEIINLVEEHKKKSWSLRILVLKNLLKVENLLTQNFLSKSFAKGDVVTNSVDSKLISATKNYVLYNDYSLLKSVIFYPKWNVPRN